VHQAGKQQARAGGRARGRGDQPRSREDDAERRVPRGPLLPPQGHRAYRAAAARAARRDPDADRLLHRALRPQVQPAGAAALRAPAPAVHDLRLAGQHPRAREHDQARRDPAGRAIGRARDRAQHAARPGSRDAGCAVGGGRRHGRRRRAGRLSVDAVDPLSAVDAAAAGRARTRPWGRRRGRRRRRAGGGGRRFARHRGEGRGDEGGARGDRADAAAGALETPRGGADARGELQDPAQQDQGVRDLAGLAEATMESATETLASRPLPPATSLNSLGAARIVVPIVLEYAPARSVVDFGCKHGEWLSVFREHGCDRLLGFDQAKRITQGLLIDEREFTVADLRQPLLLQQRFDLAVCIEVAEHLPESAAAGLVKTLTRVAPIVLFSAALPGQGGHGHLNEQPRGYWDDLFRGDGYTAVDCLRPRIWQNAEVAWWYRQNLFM